MNPNQLRLCVCTTMCALYAGANNITVAEQPLSGALRDFSAQTGLQVAYVATLATGKTSPGTQGRTEPKAALSDILEGTDLRYQYVNDETVAIGARRGKSAKSTATGARQGRLLPSVTEPILLAQVQQTAPDGEAAEPAEGDAEGREGQAIDPDSLETVVVTGTRLPVANQTSPVVVITREQIDARGFLSAEDVIRSLPQNVSTMNTARSVTQPVGSAGTPVGSVAQGESAANLRALGTNATLVLVNGRRTVASAAFDGSQVNLSGIPAAAVERVEVILDGASAVYGSDAIGGVINFVLLDNYTGATTTLSFENSSTQAHRFEISQLLGLGWNGGNLTAALTHSETDPLVTADTGFTSLDFTSRGGPDARLSTFSQPGNVFGFGALPADNDGTSWTLADLSPANQAAAVTDRVPAHQAASGKNTSLFVKLDYEFGVESALFGEVRYAKNDTFSQNNWPFVIALVPPDNPFNKAGFPLFVASDHAAESKAGLLPLGGLSAESVDLSLTAGITAVLGSSGWRLNASATKGESETTAMTSNYDVFGNEDLARRYNPFGNGTVQDIDAFLDAFGANDPRQKGNSLVGFSAHVDRSLMELPGGAWQFVLGGELRREQLTQGGDELAVRDLSDTAPSQQVSAVYFENSLPVSDSVTIVVQGRWEQYELDSSTQSLLAGAIRPVSADLEGLVKAPVDGRTYRQFSPRIGARWEVEPSLAVRASWGKSFKAPNLTQVVGKLVQNPFPVPFPIYDPVQGEFVTGLFFDNVGNPSLRPESSETLNLGFDWDPELLNGLKASVDYSRTEFDNRIQQNPSFQIGEDFLLAHPEVIPGFALRDPLTDRLISLTAYPINVSSRTVESVDFSLSYEWDGDLGDFLVRASGAYVLEMTDVIADGIDAVELNGTTGGPNDLVITLAFEWNRAHYGLGLIRNHSDSYRHTEAASAFPAFYPEAPKVDGYTTWDIVGNYQIDGLGLKLNAGVRNVFEEDYPFAPSYAGPFDTRRVDLRGRLMFLKVQKEF